jgi:nucleoside-diphosphate-sugar epimerase
LADHENNTLTMLKLFEHVKSFRRLQKLVYAGAGCAVAEKTFSEPHATTEDEPVSLHMDSPYSISKIVGEFYSVYYFTRHNLPVVRARFQNVYGPGEILGAGEWRGTSATVWRNVVPSFIYKALKEDSLPLEGAGEATRDFIYVEDIVRGLLCCARTGKPGEVYNLASGVETSIRELADIINELTENVTPAHIGPTRDWDRSGRRFGSTVKAKRQLQFEVSVDIREGLRRTIEWTRENLPLIESCIQQHEFHMVP